MTLRMILGSVAFLVAVPVAAQSQVIIDNGTIAIGVNPAAT